MAKFFRDFPKLSGGSNIWLDGSPASVLLDNEFFDQAPVSESIYIGSAGQSQKYLGTRIESELYLGSGNLWP